MNASDRKILTDILKIQSVSRHQATMREHMAEALADAGCRVSVKDGMVFAKKGALAEPVPCYVAHLDTVHTIVDAARYAIDAYIDDAGDIIYHAYDPRTHAPRGIGGDDKCGLYVALMAARALPDVQIVLTRDEEIGALGARALPPATFAAAACLIQADRRGSTEAIINGGYDEIASEDWQAAMQPHLDAHGYQWSHMGTWTDVVAIVEDGIAGVSAVNLAAGYHRAHCEDTYIVESELHTASELAIALGRASAGKRWRHDARWEPYQRDTDRDTPPVWTQVHTWTGGKRRKNDTAVWLTPKDATATGCDVCPGSADLRTAGHLLCVECWKIAFEYVDAGWDWHNALALASDERAYGDGAYDAADAYERQQFPDDAADLDARAAEAAQTANVAPRAPRKAKVKAKTARPPERDAADLDSIL